MCSKLFPLHEHQKHHYLEYDVVRLHGVCACEGRRAGEQLEHEHAEGPVVGADVVPLVQDDLGGHVLGGPAEGPRLATHLKLLGEAEVHQLDVAGGVEQEVLGLQVPASNENEVTDPCGEVTNKLNNYPRKLRGVQRRLKMGSGQKV